MSHVTNTSAIKMPELPEVETTLRGIQPYIENNIVTNIVIRQHKLRWPIPNNLLQQLQGETVTQLERRGKYLLFKVGAGTLILHLGMSGSLRLLMQQVLPQKHDHVYIEFSNAVILRFTDPRRFGALLWIKGNPYLHPLLINLGPEPFDSRFSAKYLWQKAQRRIMSIKSFIMNNTIVVGIGNIYATEALFLAGIYPGVQAKSLTQDRMANLIKVIKYVLRHAIKQGGTTLKDFVNSEGKPGYFSHQLKAYGRSGLPCVKCNLPLQAMRIGQRNTAYCKNCQS